MQDMIQASVRAFCAAFAAVAVFVLPSAAQTVARVGEAEFDSLNGALAAVAADPSHKVLTWVDASVWDSDKPAYYNGTAYSTLSAAIIAANSANLSAAAAIYIRPGFAGAKSDGFVGVHDPIKTSITVFGNNASLNQAWAPTLEHYTGGADNGEHALTKDIAFGIYSLHNGAGAWGCRKTDWTVTIVMENCQNANECYMRWYSGSGRTDMTVRNCTFLYGDAAGNVVAGGLAAGWPVAVYGNGSIAVDGCAFTGNVAAVVGCLDAKNADLTLSIANTTFANLKGQDGCKGGIRIAAAHDGSIALTMDSCQFADGSAAPADITMGDGKDSKSCATFSYSIKNTTCSMIVTEKGTSTTRSRSVVASSTATTGNNLAASPIARVGGTEYVSLAEAIAAAVSAKDGVPVELLSDVDLTGEAWTSVAYPTGALVIDGKGFTVRGLSAGLLAKTGSGGHHLTVRNIVFDAATVTDTTDYAAVVCGYADSVPECVFENVTIRNSTVSGSNYAGAFIGYWAAYYVEDTVTFTNCTVSGCTISGGGSAGALIGHAMGNVNGKVTVVDTTVVGNAISSTGSSTIKAGSLVGTVGAAYVSAEGTGRGGLFASAVVSNNTVTSHGAAITTVYGRQGTSTGLLTLTPGGAYDAKPVADADAAWAKVVEGYALTENDGIWTVAEKPKNFYVDAQDANLWHIANADGLKEFRDSVNATPATYNGKTIQLDADCDLGNAEWTPVMAANLTFDGNGHTISNFKVTSNGKNVGLFGTATISTIRDLTVRNATVTGINHVAAIAGDGLCGHFINCKVYDSVITTQVYNDDDGDKAGAICGYLSGESTAEVTNCHVENCTITGYRDCGGAVGMANVTATVTGTTVKSTTVVNVQTPNPENYKTDAQFNMGQVVGRTVSGATISGNTATDVTIQYPTYVAKIGDVRYASLAAAVAAVKDGETVVVLESGNVVTGYAKQIGEAGYSEAAGANRLVFGTDAKFTLDLNGKELCGRINFTKGDMTVANGTVRAATQALNIFGSKDFTQAPYSTITLAADATVRANYGFAIFAGDPGNTMWPLGFGETVNVYGKVYAPSPVFVSGNVGMDTYEENIGTQPSIEALVAEKGMSVSQMMFAYGPTINVYGGAELGASLEGGNENSPQGVSVQGGARLNVYGGTISGAEAVGVKGGSVYVSGGSLVGTGAKCDPIGAIQSGTESSGAAISCSTTYNANYPIAVCVSGGTLKSVNNSALLVAHSRSGQTVLPVVQGIAVAVTGGTFAGGEGQAAILVDAADPGDAVPMPAAFITGGTFSSDPTALLAEGYDKVANADGTYSVCTMVKKDDGTTSVPAVEQASTSTVNEQKVESVVKDETAKEAIKSETVVEGVKLTTQAETNQTGAVVVPSGMQAVVDAAKAKNPALGQALESSSATMVTVKVDVVVSPVVYTNAEAAAEQSVASFRLEPRATVTVVNQTSGEEATSKSETVAVDNVMIDKTTGIDVTVYTGFRPAMVVHKDANGKVIETFTGDEITWDEAKRKITVTITHFSTIEAVKVSYAAQSGDGVYDTLAEAFAAVPEGTETTVTLLKDLTLTAPVTLATNKTATFDFSGRTLTGGSIVSEGALTLKGGTTDAALSCANGGTMAITAGSYDTALPEPEKPAATNAGPFYVSGGGFATPVPLAYCAPGYLPNFATSAPYGVQDADIYIRSITAAQRYPWNGYVDIHFDVCWGAEKGTARLFVEAYEGDVPLSMAQATLVDEDGNPFDGSCDKGFVITAPTKKSMHLMWNSDVDGAVKSRVAEGVNFKFIAK